MFLRWLEHPRAHFRITALALALLLPALAVGEVLDDYVLQLKAQHTTGIAGLRAEPLWLFTFTTGAPEQNRLLMNEGVLLPWWTNEQHLNAFFRPLSSLTHVLDFACFPDAPWLMHAHSLLWYAVLLLALAHVFRRFSMSSSDAVVGVLALLLYAIDDAHGATVGWIANRNAVIAVALAVPALSSLDRARRGGFGAGYLLGPMCFALGLCAGETAISIFGYVVAYALCLDRGPFRERALSVLPYVLLIAAHRGIYHHFGLGSFGSSAYHDPLQEPVAFALSVAYNLPVLISAQLGAPIADFAFWGNPSVRLPLLLVSCVTLACLGWLAFSLLRRDAHARFWALGMLLAAVPVSASLPGERLLMCVGIGASQLVARLVMPLLSMTREQLHAEPKLRALFAGGLVVAHMVVAPLLLPIRAHAMGAVGRVVARIDAGVPRSNDMREKTLFIVNAPFDAAVSYLQPMRQLHGTPRPAHLYWLASASSEITVTRTAKQTLRVTLADGFLRRPEETHYRSDVTSLGVGAKVPLDEMEASIVQVTADGRPATVDFTFEKPLDSTQTVFMCYRDGVLVPWRLPTMGSSERFPAEEFFQVIGQEVTR